MLSIIPNLVELINPGALNLIVDESNPFSSFILEKSLNYINLIID
jgi:hypothetical protein